ncbi:MAG: helix-turn-helix domain-containing protein [Candidatus Caldarchaeum sp.]
MEETELVEKLQKVFGFNKYQAKAYVAVLQGYSKPADVARKSKIPITRVYDVLSSLCENGFLTRTSDGYRVTEPVSAFTFWLERERARMESLMMEKKRVMEQIIPTVSRLRERGTVENEAAILRGLQPVVVKLREMVDSGTRFVFAVKKAVKLKEEFKKVVAAFPEKKFLFILHPSVQMSKEDYEFLESIGAGVFFSEGVLLDVLVTDGGEAVIGLPLDDEPVVVWVRDRGFASSLMRSLEALVAG